MAAEAEAEASTSMMMVMADSSNFLFSDEDEGEDNGNGSDRDDCDDMVYEDMHNLIANAHSFSTVVPSSISGTGSGNAIAAGRGETRPDNLSH